jgi:hypothetical protein
LTDADNMVGYVSPHSIRSYGMLKWDDWVQCEESADLVVWEEWEAWVNGELCEGESLPKNEDRCCADSQRQNDLTDLPF